MDAKDTLTVATSLSNESQTRVSSCSNHTPPSASLMLAHETPRLIHLEDLRGDATKMAVWPLSHKRVSRPVSHDKFQHCSVLLSERMSYISSILAPQSEEGVNVTAKQTHFAYIIQRDNTRGRVFTASNNRQRQFHRRLLRYIKTSAQHRAR